MATPDAQHAAHEPVPHPSDAPLAFEIVGPMVPQLSAGVIKALAVSSDKRNPALPEAPTVMQAGVVGYNVASWNALAAPAGTPADVLDKLGKLGMRLQGSSAAELQALLARPGGEDRAGMTPATG